MTGIRNPLKRLCGTKIVAAFLLVLAFLLLQSQKVSAADMGDMEKAAQAGDLELWLDSACAQLAVTNNRTGMIWESGIGEETFDISTLNANFQKKIQSLFIINYTDLKKGYGAVTSAPLADLEYETRVEKYDGGATIYYDLKTPQVKLAVDLKLEEGRLVVTLPEADFEEYGKYSVTSIRMLPYFLGAPDGIEGYYFYPDGSGALMEFQDVAHFGEKELSLNVYGNLTKYPELLPRWTQEDPLVMLPVFGAAVEEHGILAVITQGAETSQIKVLPTNAVVPVNSMNCEFLFRRSFPDQRVKDQSVAIFDQDYIKGDRSLTFLFLEEGKNSYSDMAVACREYFMEEEGLVQKSGEEVRVSLDLFMGVKEKGMLFDVFKTATSFEQAQTIIDYFRDAGVENMDVQLKAWMKNGYNSQPVQFPPASDLGGKKGLNKLAAYAADNNQRLSLIVDFVEANSKAGSFSERNDVVYLGNKGILTNEKESRFLLEPMVVKKNFDSFVKASDGFGLGGIELSNIGNSVLYNYKEGSVRTAGEAVAIYREMLMALKEKYGYAAVQGGNTYVTPYVDKVTDIPDRDNGYQLTTKTVPFYQIVFHGILDYTGTAGNLTSDLQKEKLKWVELGYMPYYELTYTGSEILMDTAYSNLYSSGYKEWGQNLIDNYMEFSQNLQGIWNETIQSHEELQEEVYRVIYSNGTAIYVNYTDAPVTVESVTVEAMDYAVKEVG